MAEVAASRAVPVWRPVRGGNAFEITVARLAQAIKLGLVSEGDRLPAERDLAERLQVSRVTLREAIRAFREAGYLESRRGRTGGTFVVARAGAPVPAQRRPGIIEGPGPSGGDPARVARRNATRPKAGRRATALASRAGAVVDIAVPPRSDPAELAREMGDALHDALDFRRVIEPGAAGLAARRTLSEAERQHLVACLTASRDREPSSRRVADSRLHLAIAAASGSPSLASSIADVQLTLDRLLAAIPVLRKNLDHSDAQHSRIVEAILAGDAASARAAMEEHCD